MQNDPAMQMVNLKEDSLEVGSQISNKHLRTKESVHITIQARKLLITLNHLCIASNM